MGSETKEVRGRPAEWKAEKDCNVQWTGGAQPLILGNNLKKEEYVAIKKDEVVRAMTDFQIKIKDKE